MNSPQSIVPQKHLSTGYLKIIQTLNVDLQNEAAVVDCSPMLLLDLIVNLEIELIFQLSTNKFTELSSHPTQSDTASSFPSALVTITKYEFASD